MWFVCVTVSKTGRNKFLLYMNNPADGSWIGCIGLDVQIITNTESIELGVIDNIFIRHFLNVRKLDEFVDKYLISQSGNSIIKQSGNGDESFTDDVQEATNEMVKCSLKILNLCLRRLGIFIIIIRLGIKVYENSKKTNCLFTNNWVFCLRSKIFFNII